MTLAPTKMGRTGESENGNQAGREFFWRHLLTKN